MKNKFKKYGRVEIDDATTGTYYYCALPAPVETTKKAGKGAKKKIPKTTVSFCMTGDKDLGTDKFCPSGKTKRKELKTQGNLLRNFKKSMTTWENKNMKGGANMFKCAETLGLDTDATQWSHDTLTKYNKKYGKTVPRNAWLGVKAFPKTPKKGKKKNPAPSCAALFTDQNGKKLTTLKAKKFVKVATKTLVKVLEKSPHFCA